MIATVISKLKCISTVKFFCFFLVLWREGEGGARGVGAPDSQVAEPIAPRVRSNSASPPFPALSLSAAHSHISEAGTGSGAGIGSGEEESRSCWQVHPGCVYPGHGWFTGNSQPRFCLILHKHTKLLLVYILNLLGNNVAKVSDWDSFPPFQCSILL